jgi:hypothetical protein
MVGDQIGDFRVIEKIGEGGMGVVYKAVDVRLDRPVAIKMLNASLIHNPDLVQRFQAEARAQANLNHTNLATLYAFLVDQGNAYMVMEFVEGENFEQIIRRNGPIQPNDAIPWFKQALLGIGAAHRVGVIHRDIKPSNLMLNRQGIVKVMDFGIAKAMGTRGTTRTGMQMGTLAYMPPEQIQNHTVDVRSDIYALGVTLYEMLSGHVPFESDSEFKIMQDHVSTPPPPLSSYYPYAPREFERVVDKALAKNPADRFQTVEEFGAALEHPERIAPASPMPVQPTPASQRTVIESRPGEAIPQTVAAFPATQAGSPATLAAVTAPAQPVRPAFDARKMIVGGVIGAAVILLAIVLWPGKTPPPPVATSVGGVAAGAAGLSSQMPLASPHNQGVEEIVAAAGAQEDTPANAQPPAPAPSQRPTSYQTGVVPARPQTVQTRPQAASPQSPVIARLAEPQSFMVTHHHAQPSATQGQNYFCAGPLIVKPDGTVSYSCAGTNDPSRRCESVVFPPGSIRQLKLQGTDGLHLSTSMGEWDFYEYNVAGSIRGAYQAILPFVQ